MTYQVLYKQHIIITYTFDYLTFSIKLMLDYPANSSMKLIMKNYKEPPQTWRYELSLVSCKNE